MSFDRFSFPLTLEFPTTKISIRDVKINETENLYSNNNK